MVQLIHQLLINSVYKKPDKIAVMHGKEGLTYSQIYTYSLKLARFFIDSGIKKEDRICFYLEKRFEKVVSIFGISLAGGVMVPIRRLSSLNQAIHIINDSKARVLITTSTRLDAILEHIEQMPTLSIIISIGGYEESLIQKKVLLISWDEIMANESTVSFDANVAEHDLAAILYTSGSTGRPKGVVLTHFNIMTGTKKVSDYLKITEKDRLLSILTFGFDYGLNQLTTTFLNCAQIILLDYLFPKDIFWAVERYKVTGLAAVATTWIQLLQISWEKSSMDKLRYITNSGGAIPKNYVKELRKRLPGTDIYLMYGLTEAFRSTYLDPSLVDDYPTSIGKAVPGEKVLVLDNKNQPVKPGQVGELVHQGGFVSQGYWNDLELTALRFRRNPLQQKEVPIPEMVVYSGDQVRIDQEGFLYFVGRKDEMIKCAGNRISPTEVEEIIYRFGIVQDAVAFGMPHDVYGQVVCVVLTLRPGMETDESKLKKLCRETMPPFMVPEKIEIRKILSNNQNGKLDRSVIRKEIYARHGIKQRLQS
jgi:acyl-CoA ligase (AMP-forming) (exosortase A-associated)